MNVSAGPTRWPCSPAATPRPARVPGRFSRCPKRPHRIVRGSADRDAPAAGRGDGSGLQSALQSATELVSSASSSVKQVLASPTEAAEPLPPREQNHEPANGSNGASSGTHHGSSNPLDQAAKRLKLAAKAVTGQSVNSVAASIDELSSGTREASEGLQGAADKLDRQLKSALSSKDPVNAAPTSEEEQAQLEEGANFLDKASVVAKRVTGALRELAPSRGSGGEDLMDSVSDHLESAGERVQKIGTHVHQAVASASGQSLDEGAEEAKKKLPRNRPSAMANFILDQFLPLGLLLAMVVGYGAPSLGAALASDTLHGWLIAAGFLLVGLAPTSKARVSADALVAWLKLAFKHLDAWRCRYVWPRSGLAAAAIDLQTNSTIGIFMIQGMNLRRGEAAKALLSYKASLYGALSILFITPLFALAALRMPFLPPEFAFGLAVFCCMPTTLSSGVSLTQAVGGNAALAVLLTVGTNLAGIFTMPFVLCGLLGAGRQAVVLAPGALLRNLLRSILAPLLVGAAARAFIPGVAQRVDSNKRAMSLASAVLLITVPWMQISRVAASGVSVSPAALAAVVAAGAALHVAFLALNTGVVHALQLGGGSNPGDYVQEGMGRLSKRQQREQALGVERAVVLVASQKTLPVAVTVLNQLAAAMPGAVGLAVIPCVVSHLVQIVLDSLLVSWWKRRDADGSLLDSVADSVLTVEHNHS